MNLRIKIIAFIIGLIFFLIVFRSVKKNSMRPSYAILWLSISLFLISISVLEFFYRWMAYNVVGLSDARHIVYIALFGFLLIYIFYLTLKISQMSDRIQSLISTLAILEETSKAKDKANGPK